VVVEGATVTDPAPLALSVLLDPSLPAMVTEVVLLVLYCSVTLDAEEQTVVLCWK
jgi:hypothetical protein